jgi:hypothetical protein
MNNNPPSGRPISIQEAGGIIPFLNQPAKVAKHHGFSGTELDSIMRDTISDKTKAIIIRDKSHIRSYNTVKGWMRKWRVEND